MKSLYESILDDDTLDVADKNAERLVTVLSTARILVDELDIVQSNSTEGSNKTSYMHPVNFRFNPKNPMPSDVFGTIRKRLDRFEKRMKNELNLGTNINISHKRASLIDPSIARKYGLKQAYDNTCQYDIRFFDKDRLVLGNVFIKVQRDEVSEAIIAYLQVNLRNGIDNRQWYRVLIERMDENK